jgi:Gtr1/RagA G protein conserved region
MWWCLSVFCSTVCHRFVLSMFFALMNMLRFAKASASTVHVCLTFILFRSGKSSIQKVVFHKMSPNDTLFLQSTTQIVKDGKFNYMSIYYFMCNDLPVMMNYILIFGCFSSMGLYICNRDGNS